MASEVWAGGPHGLFRREKPPPGRLAALVVVELDALRHRLLDGLARLRRVGAGYAGEQLRTIGYAGDRRGQRLAGVSPGHQLAAGVAHRVAGGEAALRIV